MKKSAAIDVIYTIIEETRDQVPSKETANKILEALITLGLRPPFRDYIEHYTWKNDNSWEKE